MTWEQAEDGRYRWRPDSDRWRYRERAESLPRWIESSLGERRPDYSAASPPPSPSPPWTASSARSTKSLDDLEDRHRPEGSEAEEDPYEDQSDHGVAYAEAITSSDENAGNVLPSTPVCSRCQGLTIEAITKEQGYHHSSLRNISMSAKTCTLCHMIYETHSGKSSSWVDQALERYQVFVSLQSAQREASECNGHDRKTGAGSLWITTMDTTPELGDPVYAGGGKFGKIEYEADENGHAVVRGRPLACFTIEDDPAAVAGMHWVRTLGENTASDVSFDVARTWLHQCLAVQEDKWDYQLFLRSHWEVPLTDHAWSEDDVVADKAVERLETDLPARLVDLQPNDDDDDVSAQPRLIHTNGTDPRNEHVIYATISYCWGSPVARSWLTTSENVIVRMRGFAIEVLPPTVRDAFVIAKRLGIRYIWVDALCILQGDATDWAKESAKMAGIYRGSVLTIAASWATSVNEGCFNFQSNSHFHRFDKLVGVDSTLSDGQRSRIYVYSDSRPDLYQRDVTRGALARRAWCFQEQTLSRRTLYYTTSQLIWDCEHCRLTEDNFPLKKADPLYPITGLDSPLTGGSLLQLWYVDCVTDFARRSITYGSDKLVAISALAKATYLNKHVEYLAGLWKDSVMTGLMWQRRGKGKKSKDYRCPSWSWASQDSAVAYWLATGRRRDGPGFTSNPTDSMIDPSWHGLKAKVLEARTEVDEHNAYGMVTGGFIRLQTYVATGRVLRDNFGTWSRGSCRQRKLVFNLPATPLIVEGIAHLDDHDEAETRFVCAFLAEYNSSGVFMLLHPPCVDARQYVRKGIAEVENDILSGNREIKELARLVTPATLTIL